MSNPVTPLQQAQPPARAPQAANGQAQAAIARASQRTGVDFSYLLAQARLESGLDPQARARTSSATGLFQFIDQTWLATIDRHGDSLGLGHLAQAIETRGGRAVVTDPATRAAILDLRFDPEVSSLMAGALATDNRAALLPVLGREPDHAELYLAHFLGAEGASRFLGALGQDPGGSAAALLPAPARANRAIFYDPSGAPRSLAGVMGVIRARVDSAGAQGGPMPDSFAPPGWTPPVAAGGPNAGWAARGAPPLPDATARPSMAETLRTSFALAGEAGSQSPGLAHIRNAYARLEAFGL